MEKYLRGGEGENRQDLEIVPGWICMVPVNTTNLYSASTLALNELVKFLQRDWNISSVEEKRAACD